VSKGRQVCKKYKYDSGVKVRVRRVDMGFWQGRVPGLEPEGGGWCACYFV